MIKFDPYDIVLVKKDKTVLSKLMAYFSKDDYTHCFIINKDGLAVDLDPRNKPHNLKIKSPYLWDENNVEVYSIDELLLNEDEKYKIDEFIFLNGRCKYDIVDCILLCLHLPPNRDNHYNCLSFLSALLKHAKFHCNVIKISDFKKLNYLKEK